MKYEDLYKQFHLSRDAKDNLNQLSKNQSVLENKPYIPLAIRSVVIDGEKSTITEVRKTYGKLVWYDSRAL
ncbi:hypothetical protein Q9887_001094 [Vibrio fluvialis]|nr:hypothetical protein [Vibrio fluvialis]